MPFTAQLIFSGLGVAVLHSGATGSRDNPEAVSLATIDVDPPGAVHIARLCILARDISAPLDQALEDMLVDSNGEPFVDLRLKGRRLRLVADRESTQDFTAEWLASTSDLSAAASSHPEALDWLVHTRNDLGITNPRLPETGAPEYSAVLTLPGGRLRAGRWLYDSNREPEEWSFGTQTTYRPLADRLIWERAGVSRLVLIDESTNEEIYSLDDVATRLQEGIPDDQPAIVRLSFTNQPKDGTTGRFLTPGHLPLLGRIAPQGTKVAKLNRKNNTISSTSHGACPPSVIEN